jgi:LPS export ABC transporter protein LptC
MRRRLRWLVMAVLAVVLAAGGWLLQRSFAARQRAQQARPIVDILPNVAQRIQNFHRVKVDNGRKVWEVSAREAQYLEEEQVVRVDAPVVEVYLEDGRTVALRGQGGKVFLAARELQRVELEGDIVVQLGDYAMSTDAAHYDADRGVIVAPGRVRITGAGFELQGEHMEVDVAAEQLVLSQRVQTTLWPRST